MYKPLKNYKINHAFNLPMPSLMNIVIHSSFPVQCGFVPLVSQVYLGLPERVYPGLQTKVTVGGVPLAVPVGSRQESMVVQHTSLQSPAKYRCDKQYEWR